MLRRFDWKKPPDVEYPALYPELHTAPIALIAKRCEEETERFRRERASDSRFCFELFRRAVLDRGDQAWELILSAYRAQVLSWVRRHPAYPSLRDDAQDLADLAFERMWVALTPEKFRASATDLRAVLTYLQMCVNSVVQDRVRADRRRDHEVDIDAEDRLETEAGPTIDPADEALDNVRSQMLWREIQARLQDDRERIAMHESFLLGLKPQEIQARHPAAFREVVDVYRAKQNVILRLRRDPAFSAAFGADD